MNGKMHVIAGIALLGMLGACDDGSSDPSDPSGSNAASTGETAPGTDSDHGETGESTDGSSPAGPGPLVVVTERESPEVALQYLHVLDDWPSSGELDDTSAFELGEFVNVRAYGDAVFVHQPNDASVTKYAIAEDRTIGVDQRISFALYGVAGYDAEVIWASDDRAYLVDEASAQIIVWNPTEMTITSVVPIDPALLTKDGLPVQFQQGVAMGGYGFTAVNWRNWETFDYYPAAAMGIFDATSDEPQITVIEDPRCAPSVALGPFASADGRVYLVSDAALGFDAVASPQPTTLPLCALRVEPGEAAFDPDFFVDLREATGSPAFYTAHPMREDKLLVNIWAVDVDVATVANPNDPNWYWEYPPYFEYAIVDLATQTSIPVLDLPRAAVQFSKTLRVDDTAYVQLYRDDGGTVLYRVEPDATVAQVLENPSGVDVQYLGRLDRSSQ